VSYGWSVYVIALVVITLGGCAWLLLANRRATRDDGAPGTMHEHEYDGLREYNNPMPAWWMWLFVGTLLWAPLYFLLYPGFGHFRGLLGWSSQGQYEAEVAAADARFGPLFARFVGTPLDELARDEQATEIGGRLFAHHCAQCHGSDARGGRGYPNLTDGDWLYGGEPERVVQTITSGRIGNMPGLGPVVGAEGVKNLAQYVLALSGRPHDAERAAAAAGQFAQICAACHGADGRGNQAVGAPNLTDDIWLHGGRVEDIEAQIESGRLNQMPAHGDQIGPEKIHLLAAYVLSLQPAR
jgi:cytochrome c oxidase cbb3-type subunit III